MYEVKINFEADTREDVALRLEEIISSIRRGINAGIDYELYEGSGEDEMDDES